MPISPSTAIGSNGIGSLGIGSGGLSASAFCPLLTWTPSVETNSSGAFSGTPAIRLTITNDGGGAGSYVTYGLPQWISATGKVSAELRFISSSANTSTHNLYIQQGVTTICALSYRPSTQVLYDLVGLANVATLLTGGEGYTFNIVLDQAAGTATFEDSEANSGSITVNGAYDNSLATFWMTGGGTGVSEIGVHEINAGTQAFTLASSDGKYCDYT